MFPKCLLDQVLTSRHSSGIPAARFRTPQCLGWAIPEAALTQTGEEGRPAGGGGGYAACLPAGAVTAVQGQGTCNQEGLGWAQIPQRCLCRPRGPREEDDWASSILTFWSGRSSGRTSKDGFLSARYLWPTLLAAPLNLLAASSPSP